ncbi:uncharacterized protein BDW43DRAFT_312889 [Aspergillus alliaceus]|uniref:uncharacterized protein n=1 Tax=Petromyces alliaceus TaxID=209559 RepID=UPI0012A6D622|nr:uncharacterized protein BDW43DRAFT_312889 [Aspergillus alliaceus]KAB8231669.1 hypothetical protein BDW43DRAFT_312889 [Aspergillus alliaceus]
MKVNRDGAEAILSPYDTSLSFEQRRAEPPPHRTSVSFADIHDIWTTGSIELEDIDRQLVITHDIEGGCLTVPVDGNKDFDMYFTEDGFLELVCLGEEWSSGQGNFKRVKLVRERSGLLW